MSYPEHNKHESGAKPDIALHPLSGKAMEEIIGVPFVVAVITRSFMKTLQRRLHHVQGYFRYLKVTYAA